MSVIITKYMVALSKSSWPDLVDFIISILPGWIKISINVWWLFLKTYNEQFDFIFECICLICCHVNLKIQDAIPPAIFVQLCSFFLFINLTQNATKLLFLNWVFYTNKYRPYKFIAKKEQNLDNKKWYICYSLFIHILSLKVESRSKLTLQNI